MVEQPRLGGNLALASILAILSYVPFELVAKGTLIVCALLFIWDPLPPLTRLLPLVCLFIVSFLSRLYKRYEAFQEDQDIQLIHHPAEADTRREKED